MRRGSLVGPIILILIGALFLADNLYPQISVVDILGRYWPFLLIGWGVLRLLEVLYWAARRRPLTGAGVSGGEWVLVVFLCIFGSGLFFASTAVGHWPPTSLRVKGIEVFGEPFDYPLEEKRVPAGKAVRVIVENFRGNARIAGVDALEVKVSGRKTVRAMRQEDADEANSASPLEVVSQGDTIIVRTNQDRSRSERYITEDLEITVPKGASIEGRGRYGDFDVNDVEGNVEINSDNAGVRVHNIGGNFTVDLRRSDIVRAVRVRGDATLKGRGHDVELEGIEGLVTISGAYSGDVQFRNLAKPLRYEGPQSDIRVERCPGEIRMARGFFHAENLIGPIVINARSRDVRLHDFTQSLELTVERGDVELRPGRLPLAKMEVLTRNGSIDLALPEQAKFALKAEVHKGEIQNEYGSVLRQDDEGRGARLMGSVGDGPAVALTSDRGTITVRKSSAAEMISPLTPEPVKPPALPRTPRSETTL